MIPQYSKSADAEVLAAIERNLDGRKTFAEQAHDFAVKHGAPDGGFYGSSFAGSFRISSVSAPKMPTEGRWTRGYSNRGWRPFKNNPVCKEMEAIRFKAERLPGLPETVDSVRDSDWRHYMMTPAPFIWDGVAWLGFHSAPDSEIEESLGPQWVEILTSEYYAAHEAKWPKERAS